MNLLTGLLTPHWWSPRKSKELRDFNIVKKITQYQKSDEIDKALQAHGFKKLTLTFLIFIAVSTHDKITKYFY